MIIKAYSPKTENWVTLEYDSIREAIKRNPHLTKFEEVIGRELD